MNKAHHGLPECYDETYKEMLEHLSCASSNKRKDKPCTAFWPMQGELYEKGEGLMVIGRAVNGWSVKGCSEDSEGKGWCAKDLSRPETREHLIHGIRRLSEDLSYKGWKNSAEEVNIRPKLKIEENCSDCPMSWVVEKAGSKNGGYNTNLSAFWRVNKKILENLRLETGSEERWSSHLCWSNLYKVAPLETGNPLESSKKVQKKYSAELLKIELKTYAPKYVLVVAGKKWYEPFVDCLGIEKAESSSEDNLVEKTGRKDGQVWVFAKHPQGRPQECFVSEVSKAFRELETS